MNRRIKAMLATLPYREMVELAREIDDALKHGGADEVADALVGLAANEDTEFVKKERTMLHSQFTRKKNITIQPYEKGYKISVSSSGNSVDIYSEDVRDGISQILDNLVALRCLS